MTSSTSTIVLYVTRLVCHVTHYIELLVSKAPGIFGASPYEDVRDFDLSDIVRAQLEAAGAALRGFLSEGKAELRKVLQTWYGKLSRSCEDTEDDSAVADNTKMMCTIQMHQILMMRNAPINAGNVDSVVAAIVFLTNRKQINFSLGKPPGSHEACIPETLIFEAICHLRRRIITFVHSSANQRTLNRIGDAAVRISGSAGSAEAREDDERSKWGLVDGKRNMSLLAAVAPIGVTGDGSGGLAVARVGASLQHDTLLDIGLFQLTLKSSHPQVLPADLKSMVDVQDVFGDAPIQACLASRAMRCDVYRLVGSGHEIARWKRIDERAEMPQAPLEHHREYVWHQEAATVSQPLSLSASASASTIAHPEVPVAP